MNSVSRLDSVRYIRHSMKSAIGLQLIVTLSMTACAALSEPKMIGTDVDQWSHYAFSDGSDTVAIKVPPHFRVFNSSLPELTYKRAQRLLLDAQYDFGTAGSPDTSEFEIRVHLVQLRAPVNSASLTAAELEGALNSAFGRPIQSTEGIQPIRESIHGRTWIHFDNTTDVTYGQTRETYATVVSATTTLLITAWYGPNIRKKSQWFDSRRRILRDVRDNTSIAGQVQ
jgi:hypothetical protein